MSNLIAAKGQWILDRVPDLISPIDYIREEFKTTIDHVLGVLVESTVVYENPRRICPDKVYGVAAEGGEMCRLKHLENTLLENYHRRVIKGNPYKTPEAHNKRWGALHQVKPEEEILIELEDYRYLEERG